MNPPEPQLPTKSALRKLLREKLSLLLLEQRQQESCQIVARLLAHPNWQSARRVFAFAPQPTEPNFLPALLPHHQLHLPRWEKTAQGTPKMVFHAVPRELWPQLTQTRWFSPSTDWPKTIPTAGDLALVPGLGFSPQGMRLGRGGGYYDAWLSQCSSAITVWGLCFSCQIISSLPADPHDYPVQAVISPQNC